VAVLKDIWRVGVLEAPADALLAPERLAATPVSWLPEEGPLRFIADPFPFWRDGRLFVFVEAYDYRDRIGRIEVITLDEHHRPVARQAALSEPWHLSYPFVWEAEGEIYMLPEAHRSGGLTLYCAEDFPTGWTSVARIELDETPIDATPVFHDGLWWLFYTPATTRAAKVGDLHLAYAERLAGPWRAHPGNPVRRDAGSARPGGAPFLADGRLVLPVQDCRRTYGGAIRPLVIHELTPTGFAAEAGEPLVPPPRFGRQRAGLHTWASAGPITLIDAKRQEVGPTSLLLDARRVLRKLRAKR
jgi:hypothetical protein